MGETPRILVVDDEESMRAWLRIELERHGWEVLDAADGTAALAIASSSQFHMALVDQKMPGLTGIETIEALRAQGFDGPAVLFTAHITPALTDATKHLGAMPISKLAGPELLRVVRMRLAEVTART